MLEKRATVLSLTRSANFLSFIHTWNIYRRRELTLKDLIHFTQALETKVFLLPRSATVDTIKAAVGGQPRSPSGRPQSYDAGDGDVYTKQASSSSVQTPLLEASLQVRSLDWRQGRLETDLQRIRPYCGTVGGRRPDTRAYVWVIHIRGCCV